MSQRTYYSAQQMLTSYRHGQDVGSPDSLFAKDAEGNTILSSDAEDEKTGLDSEAQKAANAGMIGSIFSSVGQIFTSIPAIMGMAQAPKTREQELKMAEVGLKTTRADTRGLAHQADIAAAESAATAAAVGYVAAALVIAAAIGGGVYAQAQKRR